MESKTLYENQWLSLMSSDDGYIYAHMTRAQDGNGVAVLAYRTDDTGHVSHILGRYEKNPAHGHQTFCTSITGAIDPGMDPESAVEQELLEEAGIDLKLPGWRMQSLGTCFPSKFMDMKYWLYAVDVTNMTQVAAEGDGSDGEKHCFCRWEYPHVVLGCDCPLVAIMAMRAGILNKI